MDLTECNARREWASKHLAVLQEAVCAYEQSDPYQIRQEFSPSRYTASIYVTAKPLPLDISFMAGDVLHNLRSTLDHLAWQLAMTTGAPSPAFPLGDDPDSKSWKKVFFPCTRNPARLARTLGSRSASETSPRNQGVSRRDLSLCHG